ncbi:nucleoporin [Culex quinquefasciatus]|uniref:Nucleoporin n=1 Tax=Culex quinquefasciatus TaxID=7176 RepID=B0WNS1_CULQU|nr:nucleoporin [Culex quinquefasciatus]|eukprot:XP_001850355.1 nucleoporin [Culex quinquefasciatus]
MQIGRKGVKKKLYEQQNKETSLVVAAVKQTFGNLIGQPGSGTENSTPRTPRADWRSTMVSAGNETRHVSRQLERGGSGGPICPDVGGRAEKTRHKNDVAGTDSAGSGGSSSVFGAFKGFAGVTSTPAVDPTEVQSIFASQWNRKIYEWDGGHNVRAGNHHLCHDRPEQEYAENAKALIVAVAAWISVKVKENPVCKLTPIFKDHEKYLDAIEKSSNKVDTKESTAAKPGFTFGIVAPATTTNTAAAPTPFSFGFGSTSSTPRTDFIFANVAKPTEDSKPFTPVKEMDSIFSKRFKLFVKADGNYSDRDIGTQKGGRKGTGLGAGRHQHRPDSAQHHSERGGPVQGMGKNNVIMVCVPTPETKPPSVLLLVKTDDLYETLNKNKPK